MFSGLEKYTSDNFHANPSQELTHIQKNSLSKNLLNLTSRKHLVFADLDLRETFSQSNRQFWPHTNMTDLVSVPWC